MTNEQYQKEILPNLPDHMSNEFIDYLRENNVVVKDRFDYIIIENIKYHTPENSCHTLFMKTKYDVALDVLYIPQEYDNWTMVRWKADERSIKRFHVHFFKNGIQTVDNSLANKNNLV